MKIIYPRYWTHPVISYLKILLEAFNKSAHNLTLISAKNSLERHPGVSFALQGHINRFYSGSIMKN